MAVYIANMNATDARNRGAGAKLSARRAWRIVANCETIADADGAAYWQEAARAAEMFSRRLYRIAARLDAQA